MCCYHHSLFTGAKGELVWLNGLAGFGLSCVADLSLFVRYDAMSVMKTFVQTMHKTFLIDEMR